MNLINVFLHLQSGKFFNLCACVLFIGLLISYYQNKSNNNRASEILRNVLAIGALDSFFSFICSISYVVFPNIIGIKPLIYIIKYVELGAMLFLYQGHSLYLYFSTGLEYIVLRNKKLFVVNHIWFYLGFAYLLSNIFFQNLFFVDDSLHIIAGSYIFVFYLFLVIFILKDIWVLISNYKILSNKKQYLLIVPYFVLIVFLILKCFNPEIPHDLFFFSIFLFIQVSYSQRQDLMINPLFDAKSAHAFYTECRRLFTMKSESSVCFIKISNYKNLKLFIGQNSYMELLKTISKIITGILDVYKIYGSIYYLGHGVYTVIIPGEASFKKQRIYTEIKTILQQELIIGNVKVLCNNKICIAEIPEDIKSLDYIREFAKTFDHIIPDNEGILFVSELAKDYDFLIKNHLKEIFERAKKYQYFEIRYQPIFDVDKKRYTSADVSVVINDPTYGIIGIDYFKVFAEQNGYLNYLGRFIFEKVCKFISSEEYKELNFDFITIELPASFCIEQNFINKVFNLLGKYQVTTDEIKFKITEKTTLYNAELADRKINELYNSGIHFILDGYGTGYSNIKKVVTLPFDIVKLDNNFVMKYTNPDFRVVIESTIRMFKKLNKKILLEGVEAEVMQSIIENLDYDFIQNCDISNGFIYTAPKNQQDFIDFIKRNY